MKKQRLIALMCAGIIISASLASCSNSSDFTNDETANNEEYIIMNEDGVNILHKGDHSWAPSININGKSIIRHYYDSDCGKSYMFKFPRYAVYEEVPDENAYDEICDDCFGK